MDIERELTLSGVPTFAENTSKKCITRIKNKFCFFGDIFHALLSGRFSPPTMFHMRLRQCFQLCRYPANKKVTLKHEEPPPPLNPLSYSYSIPLGKKTTTTHPSRVLWPCGLPVAPEALLHNKFAVMVNFLHKCDLFYARTRFLPRAEHFNTLYKNCGFLL